MPKKYYNKLKISDSYFIMLFGILLYIVRNSKQEVPECVSPW